MVFGSGGSGRVLQVSSGFSFDWESANGNLNWNTAVGNFIIFRITDNNLVNLRGGVQANGTYTNTSDERLKQDIEPSGYGLPEVIALEPISFTRVGDTRTEHGFSAQQVQAVIPEAVTPVYDDMLGVALIPSSPR